MLFISIAGVAFSYLLSLLLKNPFLSKALLFGVSAIVFSVFFYLRSGVKPFEKQGMLITFILLMQSIFFWLMYMQMSTSLTLFAIHNVRTEVFGLTFPPAITQSFNPFYIFLLSPLLATLYTKSEQKGTPISIPGKFAFGMFVCGLAYLLLAVSCWFHDDKGMISVIWLFSGYGLYSLGELLISAIGLSMVSKLMPIQLGGFAQAMWFITTAIGQELGGMAAEFSTIDTAAAASNLSILQGYQELFTAIGIGATLFSILLFAFVKKLTRSMNAVLVQIPIQESSY